MVSAAFLQPPGRALALVYSFSYVSPMRYKECLPGKDDPPHLFRSSSADSALTVDRARKVFGSDFTLPQRRTRFQSIQERKEVEKELYL